ncbi:MAG TPA: hypothetical protein VN808_17455, partial [Stellaceae bacterium]|nr:hypothetical protein [Stellaceae bacterium]
SARRGLRRRKSAKVVELAAVRPSLPSPETVDGRIEKSQRVTELESMIRSLVDEHTSRMAEINRMIAAKAPAGGVIAYEKKLAAVDAEIADLTRRINATRAELAKAAKPYFDLVSEALGELRRAHMAALETEVEAITKRLAVLNEIEHRIKRSGADTWLSVWRPDIPQIAGRVRRMLHPER